MYARHFGLHEKPFSLTPDTSFFYNNKSHREALNTMLLALKHSEGFIKIVGEVGTGKTLLCRKLLSILGKHQHFITAYIPNPYLTPDELKWFVAEQIGVEYSQDMPAYQLINTLNKRLIELAKERKQVVLVVDEAQAMPRETIEALRLLTNLETEKRKLLQVVLIGQPELDDLLNRDDLRQLKQRIVFSEYLEALNKRAVTNYVSSRLAAAGYKKGELFSVSAVHLLYQASGGIPRLLNILAHKSLMVAFGKKSDSVEREHVVKAVNDTVESKPIGKWMAKRDLWLWPLCGAGLALLLVALYVGVGATA